MNYFYRNETDTTIYSIVRDNYGNLQEPTPYYGSILVLLECGFVQLSPDTARDMGWP